VTKIPVDPKGRVTLPEDVCKKLGIKPGDVLEVEVEEDRLVIRRGKKKPISEFRGIFQVDHALDFKEEREIGWRDQTRRLANENPANRE